MMDNFCFSMDQEGDDLVKNETFAPYYGNKIQGPAGGDITSSKA